MMFQRRRREDAGVDLTPLIDVVFLLLIFFMVSTSFVKESQLSIRLPESEVAESEFRHGLERAAQIYAQAGMPLPRIEAIEEE